VRVALLLVASLLLALPASAGSDLPKFKKVAYKRFCNGGDITNHTSAAVGLEGNVLTFSQINTDSGFAGVLYPFYIEVVRNLRAPGKEKVIGESLATYATGNPDTDYEVRVAVSAVALFDDASQLEKVKGTLLLFDDVQGCHSELHFVARRR